MSKAQLQSIPKREIIKWKHIALIRASYKEREKNCQRNIYATLQSKGKMNHFSSAFISQYLVLCEGLLENVLFPATQFQCPWSHAFDCFLQSFVRGKKGPS